MKEKLLNTRAKRIVLALGAGLLLVCTVAIYLHFNYVTHRETTVAGSGTRSLKVVVAGNRPTVFFSGGKTGSYGLKNNGAITITPAGIGTYRLHMDIQQKYDSNAPAFGTSQGQTLAVAVTRSLPSGTYELNADIDVIGSGVTYNTAMMGGVDLSQQHFTERFTIK